MKKRPPLGVLTVLKMKSPLVFTSSNKNRNAPPLGDTETCYLEDHLANRMLIYAIDETLIGLFQSPRVEKTFVRSCFHLSLIENEINLPFYCRLCNKMRNIILDYKTAQILLISFD